MSLAVVLMVKRRLNRRVITLQSSNTSLRIFDTTLIVGKFQTLDLYAPRDKVIHVPKP
jgi:hypothetical protein